MKRTRGGTERGTEEGGKTKKKKTRKRGDLKTRGSRV